MLSLRRVVSNRSARSVRSASSLSSLQCIDKELRFSAHNYHPLPVVISRGSGAKVWDPEGKEYFDFLSAYSAVNQGHCHPKIIEAMTNQAKTLTLSSRAFYNDQLGPFAEYVTEMFGQEMLLPMNTGAEGVETAVKLARRWGYRVKKIPVNRAIIIAAEGCFHGRTQAAMAMSTEPSMIADFGPGLPGVVQVPYDDVNALEAVLRAHGPNVCGFLVEPIQGEAGVYVPSEGYLRAAKEACHKHNVLFIADEIQTGIARTGKLLAVDYEGVKPDLLILGKALSGGLYPVSAVLGSREVLLTIRPGEHGSTFGGNPLGCAIARAALEVVREEKLADRAFRLGQHFRSELRHEMSRSPWLTFVRGKGLLNAISIDASKLQASTGNSAWELCLLMANRGLLAKPTHEHIVRLAPPLVISEQELDQCIDIIRSSVHDLGKIPKDQIPNPEKLIKNPYPHH